MGVLFGPTMAPARWLLPSRRATASLLFGVLVQAASLLRGLHQHPAYPIS